LKVGDKLYRCFFANRPCDRLVGRQPDIVFIAVPSVDEYHFETATAKNVVSEAGLTPIVAVHKDLLSQDVFCEKICTQIIECRFCIVFLNGGNPNVFYEYGLMRPLRKRVISLLRKDEQCPFNVRHLDALHYPQKDLNEMLTDAVEAAVAATKSQPLPAKRSTQRPPSPFAGRVSKGLELQGVVDYGDDRLAEHAQGTAFTVKRGSNGIYFVAVLEAEWNVDDILADTMVVCRRLGRAYSTLRKALAVREEKRWDKGVEEDKARIEAIEHLHFVYATPESVPTSAQQAIILEAMRDLKERFPLPTVLVWSSNDVDALLKKGAGGSRS